MSDLRPDLTQEERALWDAIMVREQKYIGPDDECPYSKVDWWAEKCIRARRRLFAPPASEKDMGTDEFVEDGFGSAWEKCRRPDCGLQVVRPGKAQCAHDCHEPIRETQPEPSATVKRYKCRACGEVSVGEPDCCNYGKQNPEELPAATVKLAAYAAEGTGETLYRREPAATEMPEAAVDDDMPEQVSDAVRKLNRQGRYTATAHRLVAWFRASFPRVPCSVCSWPTNSDGSCARCSSRNSSQPVTPPLAMSEIEAALDWVKMQSEPNCQGQTRWPIVYEMYLRASKELSAVRTQATAPKVVKMEKVREAMALLGTLLFEYQQHMSFRKERGAIFDAALAELDAHEGRKT